MKKIPAFLLFASLCFAAIAGNKLPQTGLASFYGDRMNHHRVASGERYCKDSFTAAHRTLAFGTYVKVTNLSNQKTVIVRINDRGPHRRHRIIDLSGAAAAKLEMRRDGVAKVRIELATPQEIGKQRGYISDSLMKDTIALKSGQKIRDSLLNLEKFMIQGGAYKTLDAAMVMKKYLMDNGVRVVKIRSKKQRRHHIFKVMIGPLDIAGKEKVLSILKNKGITGLVIRL